MMGTGPYGLDRTSRARASPCRATTGTTATRRRSQGIEYTVFADGTTPPAQPPAGQDRPRHRGAHTEPRGNRDADGVELVLAEAPLDVLTYVNMTREPFSDDDFRARGRGVDGPGRRPRPHLRRSRRHRAGPDRPRRARRDARPPTCSPPSPTTSAPARCSPGEDDEPAFTVTIGTSQTAKEIAEVLAAGWDAGGPRRDDRAARRRPVVEQVAVARLRDAHEHVPERVHFGSRQLPPLSPASSPAPVCAGYRNPEVDRLLDTVWATDDDGERGGGAAQLNRCSPRTRYLPAGVPQARRGAARRTRARSIPGRSRVSRLAPQTLHFVD